MLEANSFWNCDIDPLRYIQTEKEQKTQMLKNILKPEKSGGLSNSTCFYVENMNLKIAMFYGYLTNSGFYGNNISEHGIFVCTS